MGPRVPRRLLAPGAFMLAMTGGCEGLIGADFGRPQIDTAAEGAADAGSERGPPCALPADCTSPLDASGDAYASGTERYVDAQRRLAALRVAGPATSSPASCTTTQLFWNEPDGTVHSWTAATKARIDYGFKLAANARRFYASSSFVVADRSSANQLAVYHADQPNALAASIGYAPSFVATADGVVRLDRVGVFPQPDGTLVRHWTAATGALEDLTTRLETTQPHSSFFDDVLVFPVGVTPPFALWMVNVVKKTTASVTFDGGALQESAHGAGGLVVAYGRTTGVPGLRVYRGDKDDAASLLELGDALTKRGDVLLDSVKPEHDFLSHFAIRGQRIFYGSARGIWSYDLVSGALAPVQLSAGQNVSVPDLLCVIRDANLLVYRMLGEAQIWTVPLT